MLRDSIGVVRSAHESIDAPLFVHESNPIKRYAKSVKESAATAIAAAHTNQRGFGNVLAIVIIGIFVAAAIPAALTAIGGADQTDWDPMAVTLWVLVSAAIVIGVVVGVMKLAGINTGFGGNGGGSRRRK